MPQISHTTLAFLIGGLLCALYAWMVIAPVASAKALRAYPRLTIPGQVLTLISVAWLGYNLNQVDLGGFNGAKKALVVLVPVGVVLIVRYLPDLLSVRGLCTLMLLGGKPLLVIARWHGTAASIVLVTFFYLLIVKSMVLVVYPHLWFRGLNWMEESVSRYRACAAGGIGIGLVLIVSGILSV
jgi:hypothetical protein